MTGTPTTTPASPGSSAATAAATYDPSDIPYNTARLVPLLDVREKRPHIGNRLRRAVEVQNRVVARERQREAARATRAVMRKYGYRDVEPRLMQPRGSKGKHVGQRVAHSGAVQAHDPRRRIWLSQHPGVHRVVQSVLEVTLRSGNRRIRSIRTREGRVPDQHAPDPA